MNFVPIVSTDGTNVISISRNKELPTQEPIKSILAINYTMKQSMLVLIITLTLCSNWLIREELMEFYLKN